MPRLTDYLDVKTLQQLQDAFAMVARLPLRLCNTDGKYITKPSALKLGHAAQPHPDAAADGGAGTMDAVAESVIAAMDPAVLAAGGWCDVPVLVSEDVVGRIILGGTEGSSRSHHPKPGEAAEVPTAVLRYLGLMANVISRMCDREHQLRERVQDLAALYHLTGEFTSQRDLQSLLNLVASRVVEVLGAKACSIRLLSEDHKELVIKAVANMSDDYLGKGPILVSASQIDQEALSTLKPVYIADERTDPRILYPAQARKEGIVSALCAPFVYKGRPEGVIHVYTGKLHKFDWFEVSLLTAIAGEAAAAIVNSRLHAEAVSAASMKKALQTAGEVQRRMIPSEMPKLPGFEIGALYVSSYELGGDFFDLISLPPDNLGIAICDVVGKGVRASLLMASIRASLRAHAANIYDMNTVMQRVNRDLCEDALTSDFATLLYGVLDVRNRRFTYCNAGHPAAMLLRGGKTTELSSGGMVIGIDPQADYQWESHELRGGDMILAYTDGLSEATNFADEQFGKERIEAAANVALGNGQSAQGIVRHVLWEMRRFAGLQARFDDLTMLAIKVL